MFTDPVRRQAMERARDTGRRAASGKVTLVQEIAGRKQAGFLIYSPVYSGGAIPATTEERRANLKGFAYCPLRMDDLLGSILTHPSPDIRLEIFDGRTLDEEHRLFRTEHPPDRRRAHWMPITYERLVPIDVGGRQWTLNFIGTYRRDQAWWMVTGLFLTGTVLTVVLSYYTLAEARARRTAEDTAVRLRESERALRESETYLRLMLENARDYAIFSTDLRGNIISWNTGAQRLFGFEESEILGQSGAVIFTREDRKRGAPEAELKHALETGLSRDDRWHQRKDGSRLFVSGVVRPINNPAGTPIGFIKIARDVTERLHAMENLQREKSFSDTAINSLPGIFYLFDRTGRWLRWNENLETITGYTRAEILARRPLDFFIEPDRGRVAHLMNTVLETGQGTVEARLVTKDGRLLPYLFSGRRVLLNGVPCFTGLGVDISERSRVEQELREAQERLRSYTTELEKRVTERTAHLRQSLESLEGVLYHVAHDLRAPLRAMASFTGILLDEYGAVLDARGRDYARRIAASARHMDELVHDLLAYGHIAHTPVTLEPVDLESLLREALALLSGEIAARSAEVRLQHPLPRVMANGKILGQVILNLLQNSLKFVPAGTRPSIHVRAEAGTVVRLWIEDNGIGIRTEHQQRIFRIFERLHNTAEFEGTGIGLAIVHKAMERMNGRVGVDSEPSRGARFWVELPRA
ncbi:MAG TPA: PAS domain S-box protein, partial [Verrucomicrobiota bacterium]|nr:PAS domain S-box protein [Verrucomicrobiota bacterium]